MDARIPCSIIGVAAPRLPGGLNFRSCPNFHEMVIYKLQPNNHVSKAFDTFDKYKRKFSHEIDVFISNQQKLKYEDRKF